MSLSDDYYDVNFIDDPGKYFKISLKYLNVYFNGNGKNMKIFNRCCYLYNNGKLQQLENIKINLQFRIQDSNPKKKLMLIVFTNFLLQINDLTNISDINNLYEKIIKHIDHEIHLGSKIYNKINEIKNIKISKLNM